jgi:uncharacterized membrane protein
MKKLFLSGIAVVVPLAFTAWVLLAVFGGIDSFINSYLDSWFNFSFYGLGLLLLVAAVFVTGVLTRTKLGNFFYNLGNKILYKIPLISKVYKLAKETIDVITTKQSFKTVVKVEFPKRDVYSIGFLTSPGTVFIPTTPNPTSGFLIQTDKYEVLDLTVEEALRYIISMGSINNLNKE